MLKFFFNLYFQYDNISVSEERQFSTFNLGYFSTQKKAKDAILVYKDQPGFNKFTLNCFKIQKFGVNFSKKNIDKSQVELYELSYENVEIEGQSEWTLFGVYASWDLANVEKGKQQKKRKYRSHVEGFHIERWKVDVDLSWKEGFELVP